MVSQGEKMTCSCKTVGQCVGRVCLALLGLLFLATYCVFWISEDWMTGSWRDDNYDANFIGLCVRLQPVPYNCCVSVDHPEKLQRGGECQWLHDKTDISGE